MTLKEIKIAVDSGKTVYWSNDGYTVIKDSIGQYMICCTKNDHCIGLTHTDRITMNGDESDFYM